MQAGKNVLVVDDDKAVTDVFRKILEAFGYEVSCCASGKCALKIAEKNKFDAVLADYYLAGMNGAETARSLRALQPDIVIIGMSGQYHGEDFKAIRGAFFLQKPIMSDQLLALLDQSITK